LTKYGRSKNVSTPNSILDKRHIRGENVEKGGCIPGLNLSSGHDLFESGTGEYFVKGVGGSTTTCRLAWRETKDTGKRIVDIRLGDGKQSAKE